MQILRFALRNLWRDCKSGELSVLLLALCVAVLSLTAVGFFTSRIAQGVRAQAAEVLAADLRLESPRPIPGWYFAQSRTLGLRSAQILSFPTAIFNGDVSQLAALQAVSANYPLRGHVRIADTPFGAARITDRIPGAGEAWIDARIIAQLKILLGAHLRIGAGTFRVTEVLDYRPDQGTGFVNLAPAAMINLADIGATQLIQPGSRVTYAALFAGAAPAVAAFRELLVAAKAPGERLREVDESSRQLNSAIDRASRFLNLASLASVLLAAVAVAMGARRYASRHVDTVALMKCMGASQSFVLAISIIELTLLALASVAAGAALGYLAQLGLAWLLKDLIRTELPPASLAPLPIALVTVTAMLIGFALPALLQLKSTPPIRVLRKTASAPPLRFGLSYAFALAALIAILWSLVRDTELVASLLAGVLGVGLVLTLAGYGLVRLTGRLRGGVGVAWRYGLANVSRRGGGSVVQIVAFGLGLMVLLLLAVVRGDLLADWRRSLPADVPNNFLINIRPEERGPLEDFLKSHGFGQPQLYPMVRARITAINGVASESLQLQGRQRARLRRTRAEFDLGGAADGRQPAGRRALVDARRIRQAAGVDLIGISGGAAAQARGYAALRRCGREPHGAGREHSQGALGQLSAEFLLGVSAGLAGRGRRHLYDQRLSHGCSAPCAGRSGPAVPHGVGLRRGRHPQTDPRDHGPRLARRAVRLSVHAGGRCRRAACRGAIDAR